MESVLKQWAPMLDPFGLLGFICESNKIEDIRTKAERLLREEPAYLDFLALPKLTVEALQALVSVLQPGAELRDRSGMDVFVGNHTPPPGGIWIPQMLGAQLQAINERAVNPYNAHHLYETLHPFRDGNGRSGRAIWLWMHKRQGTMEAVLARGFLHVFYYETLSNGR